MTKLDLTKQFKSYYTATPYPQLVAIAPVSFLSVTGTGDPSGPVFAARVQALYTVAYAVKFHYKAQNLDFTVPKLEALWEFDLERYPDCSLSEAPTLIPRPEWIFHLLIRLPELVTSDAIAACREAAYRKKGNPAILETGIRTLDEGLSVQLLHTGPFANEPASLQLLQEFMASEGLIHNGLHHEIYLTDFNKTPPEKLRTILREPVRKKNG